MTAAPGRHHSDDELEDHDLGLSHDLPRIVERQRRLGQRGMLGVFGAAGVAALCNDVFAIEGYEQSVANLAQISLDSDGIFSDGYSLQMASVTGSVDDGYTVTLNIPV